MINVQPHKICTRCVMDTSDPDIVFNDKGVCNHCLAYDQNYPVRVFHGTEAEQKLQAVTEKIKADGKGKEYDCIIGVSGGVDSTYVAYIVKKLGLRPLAIHFDNGWNSELAVSNIEKVLNKLNIDLVTYVIDWEEFKDLQMSFLKASTPDGEIPTDHAIIALLWQLANKHKVKYVISGVNYSTENVAVDGWAYGHSDWKYIRAIQKKFGTKKLKHYPHFNFFQLFYITFIRRIKQVAILNYLDYKKEAVMDVLQNELEWVYYGGKHYESVYTRFYQSYILPQKFNIDKRKAHLSSLIHSGQLTREQALLELQKEVCPKALQESDIQFAIKKFGITNQEFDQIMAAPVRSFRDYPNSSGIVKRIKKFLDFLRKKGLYAR